MKNLERLKGCCPRCGTGELYDGFLSVKPICPDCGLDLSFADAGDGPAFFVMWFSMLVTVLFAVWMEAGVGAPLWLTILLTTIVLAASTILPLRPLKTWLIKQQYKYEAREGKLVTDDME
ncbi:MAG: DUF983 domain-containing protein [Pseudomonadota bacterium]